MATSSIYHNVIIKDRKMCNALITALENAKENKHKEVYLSKKIEEVKGETIKKLFGDY